MSNNIPALHVSPPARSPYRRPLGSAKKTPAALPEIPEDSPRSPPKRSPQLASPLSQKATKEEEGDEDFLASLQKENEKLVTELNTIIASKADRMGIAREAEATIRSAPEELKAGSPGASDRRNADYILLEDQAKTARPAPSSRQAEAGSQHRPQKENARPSLDLPLQATGGSRTGRREVAKKPQQCDSAATTARNASWTQSLRGGEGRNSCGRIAVKTSGSTEGEARGPRDAEKRCKELELRLIGTQKSIRALEQGSRDKDETIAELKRELETKQRLLDTLSPGKQRLSSSRGSAQSTARPQDTQQTRELLAQLETEKQRNAQLAAENERIAAMLRQKEEEIEMYERKVAESSRGRQGGEEYSSQ